jgi:hypothetical protein
LKAKEKELKDRYEEIVKIENEVLNSEEWKMNNE